MDEFYSEQIHFEGRADQARLDKMEHNGEICPYYEKVKCHFPNLTHNFCKSCPKLAPVMSASPNIINNIL